MRRPQPLRVPQRPRSTAGRTARQLFQTVCLSGLLLAAAPQPSHAATACPVKYTLQVLADDLGIMQSSLRTLDEQAFKDGGQRLSAGLLCMSASAPAPVYAATYRLLGAYEHIDGNPEKAEAWFRTATELDPSFSWDVKDFDVGHPIRTLYDSVRSHTDHTAVALEGVSLALPAGSKLYIDGRPLEEAEATPNRPHLIQQVGTDRAVRKSWLIEGTAFPDVLLNTNGAEASNTDTVELAIDTSGKNKGSDDEPKTDRNDEESYAVQYTTPKRVRPPMKTPLLVLGGIGLGASGAAYAASWMSRQKFLETSTTDEANQFRTTTNTLVLASGGIAVAALGLGYWGVLLDGGVGFRIVRQF